MAQRYLDRFPCEEGPGGSALKGPGLVELDETFVILKSHSGCNTRTTGAPVHLRGSLTQLEPDRPHSCCLIFVCCLQVIEVICHKKVYFNISSCRCVPRPNINKYLRFSKHADVGSGIRGITIFPVNEDGAIEEGQIIAGWMVQLHLGEKTTNHLSSEPTNLKGTEVDHNMQNSLYNNNNNSMCC